MAIRDFSLGPQAGLRAAAASNLGNLVVIAGPNGAGKSTLLELLRTNRHWVAEAGTAVLSAGAYRNWRASAVSRADAYANPIASYRTALSMDAYPQWAFGMPNALQSLSGQVRTMMTSDEAHSFVKTSLIKLEDRDQALLSETWRQQGHAIAEGDVPDLFEPFRELIAALLPHLEWVGITTDTPHNVQCLFRERGGADATFDIDNLSAGEKAAITLFLPFVEQQADALQLSAASASNRPAVPVTILLDEPEIHLHPLLQLQVLELIRSYARTDVAQFIVVTHSPTILDALEDDELYLLSPSNMGPRNQLTRLATAPEKLEVARSITGATHVLTRAKPVVIVEGESLQPGRTSDAQLLKGIVPETRSWAIVPGKSRNEVIKVVRQLRTDGVALPGNPVFGLVDGDRAFDSGEGHVITWPLAMIENLLLDATAIFETLAPFGVLTGARSQRYVAEVLDRVALSRRDDEIRLRIKERFKIGRLVAEPENLDALATYASHTAAQWAAEVSSVKPLEVRQAAEQEVDSIVSNGAHLELFRGKQILSSLYQELAVSGTLSKAAFLPAIASRASRLPRARALAAPAILQIQLYFPQDLGSAIRRTNRDGAASLANECAAERQAWDDRSPNGDIRESLRRRVFQFAADEADEQSRVTISELASEIGTP